MVTEHHMVQILMQAEQDWDTAHAGGQNDPYLNLMPTLYHLQAKRIHEAIHKATTGTPPDGSTR